MGRARAFWPAVGMVAALAPAGCGESRATLWPSRDAAPADAQDDGPLSGFADAAFDASWLSPCHPGCAAGSFCLEEAYGASPFAPADSASDAALDASLLDGAPDAPPIPLGAGCHPLPSACDAHADCACVLADPWVLCPVRPTCSIDTAGQIDVLCFLPGR
jgi:hypothetical protein